MPCSGSAVESQPSALRVAALAGGWVPPPEGATGPPDMGTVMEQLEHSLMCLGLVSAY